MRHLNNYKEFNEKLGISPTDAPQVIASKEYYNKLELEVNFFKNKNSITTKLEEIYTSVGPDGSLLYDDKTLSKEVEKLKIEVEKKIGKSEIFSKYLSQLAIEREIAKKAKTQAADVDALKALKDAQDAGDQTVADPRISETEKKMNLNKTDISNLMKNLNDERKKFNDLITSMSAKNINSAKTINSPKNNKIQIGNVVSLKK